MRSAPGILVTQPAQYLRNAVSVQVLELEELPFPRLALPLPSSEKTYHIPRLPAPAPINKKSLNRNLRLLLKSNSGSKVNRTARSALATNDSGRPVPSTAHRTRVENSKSTSRCIPCDLLVPRTPRAPKERGSAFKSCFQTTGIGKI